MAVDESYFAKALGIDRSWKVDKVLLNEASGVTDLYVSAVRGGTFPCPVCGRECKVHDTYERTWRDLDMGLTMCMVHAKVPRTDCPEHGVKQIEVPWAREYSRQTLNFERRCLDMIAEMPVNAVARTMRISDDVLWGILYSFVEGARKNIDMSRVRRIGIDETSCRRRHNYITIFVDLDTRKVLFATVGRSSETVKEFVKDLIEHGGSPENITDVSCDMGGPFIKGITENLPKAHLTFDKFHVMQMANIAVETVRKDMIKTKEEKTKWKIKNLLMYRRKHLSPAKAEKLDLFLKENETIGKAYILKEMLGDIYLMETKKEAEERFDLWVTFASKAVHETMRELAEHLAAHKEGILKWFDSRISNGILEGINSVIQGVKRMARGYRLPENMITMLYLRSSGIRL